MSLDRVAREAGVDASCISLIAKFEGCLKPIGGGLFAPYRCPANVPTIGIGTTVWPDGRKVSMSDAPITREKCEEALAFDIGRRYAPGVDAVKCPWKHENMRSACISFAYNVGTGGFKRSTLAHFIKNKEYGKAADEFLKWNRGGGRVLKGLTRRRIAERKLFLTSGGVNHTVAGVIEKSPIAIDPPETGRIGRVFAWIKRVF
jgi:lysozyme